MGRHGYSDCVTEDNSYWLYRSAVERSLKGRRGQRFLRELLAALEAMPDKRLVHGAVPDGDPDLDFALVHSEGCCTLGAFAQARGIELTKIDATDPASVGAALGIARSMAAEIEYENDECAPTDPAQRHAYMVRWVRRQIGHDQ